MQIASTDTWANHASGKDFANSGKSGNSWEDAYEITSAADFAQVMENVKNGTDYAGKYFKQTADLNFGAYFWVPPTNASSASTALQFRGNYDGQNFLIDSIYEESDINYGGLFGPVAGKAAKRITFKNIHIRSGALRKAGITSYAYYVDIINCRNDAIISGDSAMGGIVGEARYCNIKDCVNTGTIIANHDSYQLQVGGIGGKVFGDRNDKDTIYVVQNCINEGDIYAMGTWVGGVLGTSLNYIKISQCVSKCNIYIKNGTSSSYRYVAGLIGEVYSDTSTIENCAFYGHIQFENHNQEIGGVAALVGIHAGWNYAFQIIACSFYGSSNKQLDLYSIGENGTLNLTITACWQKCNGTVTTSETVSSTWEQYWAVVPNMNDGLPIQKELYGGAEVANSTAAQIAAALPNAELFK